jgi:hypothetical protein
VKAFFKLRNKCPYLVTAAGLVLMISLLSNLPAAAQATTTPATTPTPAPPEMATTTQVSSPATTATSAPSGAAASTSASAPTSVPTTSPPTNAAYLTTTDSDTSVPDYTNWVTLGGGDVFVSGNKGQYKHQQDTNSGPLGGVDDFHWQQFVGKSGTFTMDGHGIFGNHDYDLKLDLTDDSLGYIRAGFTEFRTWYDPTGGYYPVNGLSFQPDDNELYVDRRSAWVEAGLTLPDLPSFIFRYEYDSREGQIDSTSWGQTTLIPGGTQTKIVPTFLGIDETRNVFMADVKDKVDDTTADLGVRYEIDHTDDSTYIEQNPNQTSNAFITDQNLEKDDLFSVHGMAETLFDKKVTFSSGFSATTIESDLAGSRIYGPAYNTPLSPTFINNGSGYIGLGGGGNTKDYVGNVNLMITPIANLVIVPSARLEYEDSNLADGFSNTTGVGAGFTSTPEVADTDNWYLDIAQSLEARYTGFRDWSLYASAEVSEDWGNEAWNSVPILDQVNMDQDWSMLGFKPTIGANWYPLPQLNFGLQYYHEIHDYDYTNNQNTVVQYPGYLQKQNFTTDDMDIRATWQALSTVSLVTRYDFQFSTVDTWSIPNGGTQAGGVESATLINHIISEDVNWTPLACLYLQVGGSYVLNTLETPVAGSAGINNLVLNGENNYWTLDASAGCEINSKTHLQLQYSYYNADDYFNNAPSSLPYGAGEVENSVTATLTRDISKSVQVSVKYGFYQNRDQTSGGQNNYDAQLVYLSTTFGF